MDAFTYFRQNLKPGDKIVRVVDSKEAFGSCVTPLTFVSHEASPFHPNTVLVESAAFPGRAAGVYPKFLFPVEYGILMQRLFNERKAALLAPWYQKMNAFFEAGALAALATREPSKTLPEEQYPSSHIYTPGQELVWEPTNITPLVEGTP